MRAEGWYDSQVAEIQSHFKCTVQGDVKYSTNRCATDLKGNLAFFIGQLDREVESKQGEQK